MQERVDAQAPAPRRRGRPGHDLDSVLRTAATVFYDRGYDGTSMSELSRRLGTTKAAIYHHVSGKAELLRLVVDRALDGLFAVAEEASATDAPAIVQLEQLVAGSVRVLTAELPYVTVLLRLRGNGRAERAALARRREFDRGVADLVAAAQADGDIRPGLDPAVTARLLFGMVNSLVEWYRPRPGSDGTEMAETISAMAFNGIRSASRGRSSST